MNSNWKQWTALIAAAVLVGVLLVALVVGTALAQGPGPWGSQDGWMGMGSGMTGSYGGMMGGYGDMMGGRGYGLAPTTGVTDTLPYGSGTCPGMDGWGYGVPTDGERLTLDQATETVEQYLAAYGDPDPSAGSEQALALAEVMEFSNGFYAQVIEEETGIGAFEILIDPITGAIHPEPGPNMMWNTKYGHMGGYGGMMGGYGYYRPPTGEMTVGPDEAIQAAQAYLDRTGSGLTADDHADPFYGYYTLHILRDGSAELAEVGQVVGMLSVNGFTGQVWHHTWHGDFVGMTEEHE